MARHLRITMVALVAGLLMAAAVSAGSLEIRGEGHRLLQIEGTFVKWGHPEAGTGATVSYGFVDEPVRFDGARNCERMVSPGVLTALSGIPGEEFQREVRAAFRAWEQVADIRFLSATSTDEADIVIGAQQLPAGRAFANVALKSAVTDGVAPIRQSLVCLNPRQRWKVGFDGDLDAYDLRYTLIHEIGHAIGLNHAGPSGQIMSFRYAETFREPQAGDIRGVVALYGRPPVDRLAEAP